MKKNLLGLLLFCCMGLFVSCGDDDNNTSVPDAGQIHISAILPKNISAGQSVITDHKLRCILELWTKGEGAKLAYRSETTATPVTDGINKLSIDLAIDAGTYDCLIWTDYIDASATKDGASHYEDKYYDTSDLRNIYAKDMNNLINNNACDAFFYRGEIQKKSGEAFILETVLERPFTKISIMEKNLREFNLLRALSVSYHAPATFNINTGKASDKSETVSYSVATFNPEATPDGTLFSAYIFANEESVYMDEIHLTFTNKHGTVQNVTVPSGLVPMLRNQHVKVGGNMMNESPLEDTEFDIVFDIDVADWESENVEISTTPLAAKVGDFIYKDGTYGQEYNEDAIDIVFALKEDFVDASDYGEAFADKEIAGYAMALESTDRIYIGGEKGAALTDADITKMETTEVYNADYTTLSYSGYEYSKAFDAIFGNSTQSKLFNQYKNLKQKYAHHAANLSSWYIPSAHQMYDICARTYGIDGSESAKNEALRAAYDSVVERLGTKARLNGNATRSAWPMTSSLDRANAKQPPITLLLDTNIAHIKSKVRGNWAYDSQYFLRPVLTIFNNK